MLSETGKNLLAFAGGKKYGVIYADPPWQFQNRTGKVAPEHKRLMRYETMTLDDIKALPVGSITGDKCHCIYGFPMRCFLMAWPLWRHGALNIRGTLSGKSEKGWPTRWQRGWVLFSQRDRASPIWHKEKVCTKSDSRSGQEPSQFDPSDEKRTQPETR